ncbi:hypothetical protein ACOZ4F_14255 [Haloarcula marismortui]|uniref:hypothetical protein n=1 Tax=Haloarcula marismortui TaxID=2238 RepID=UPI003C71B833
MMTILSDLTVQVQDQIQVLPLLLGAATSGFGYLLATYLRRKAAEDYLQEEATGQLAVASLVAVVAGFIWVLLDGSLDMGLGEIVAAGRKLAVPIMGALLLLSAWKTGKFDTLDEGAEWVASRRNGSRQVALVAACLGTFALIFQLNVLDLYLLAFPVTGLVIITVWPQAVEPTSLEN